MKRGTFDSAVADRKLAELLESFRTRSRPIRIVAKRAYWHQRVIAHLLRWITLGGQDRYLTEYVTTLGHSIYVPDGFEHWPTGPRWETLRHEAVHVSQFERYGWFVMVLLYGILPLPLGLAYGRARLEWEAYRETLRCVAELEGMEAAWDIALHEQIVARFTGPDYGWMWPFPRAIRGWIASALTDIERELRDNGAATTTI